MGAAAIVATKGRAADDILRAESRAEVYSVAYEMKLADDLYPTGTYYAHFKAGNAPEVLVFSINNYQQRN